ncbi:MAG: trigger factor [Succinivibrionaceae bacterium]
MQVSIEASEGLNRKIKVTIPTADYKKTEKSVISNFSKTKRVPGFRKGKVPTNILLKDFGFEIKNEIVNSLIQSSLYPAIVKSELKNLANSMPQISEVFDLGSDNDFSYIFEVEVNPEFELNGLTELEFTKFVSNVTDADLDNMIEKLRHQQAKWTACEEGAVAEKGDFTLIDFEGFIDGEAFEKGKSTNCPVVIGENRMIPGFEDQIIGHKINEEFEINVTFPENYQAAHLANKAAVFKTKINKISKAQLPEVNEDFIKVFGVQGSVEDFKNQVRKNMERQLKFSLSKENESSVYQTLMDKYANDIEVPPRLKGEYVAHFKKTAEKEKQVFDENNANLNAERSIRSSLIFGALTKKFDLKLDDARVEEYLNDISSAYEDAEAYKKAVRDNAEQFNSVKNHIYTLQITEAVMNSGKVIEKFKGFSEIVKYPYF